MKKNIQLFRYLGLLGFFVLLFGVQSVMAASLSEIKFVRKTNLNLDIYEVKNKSAMQITRQRTPLAEFPFTAKVNFERLGKELQQLRAINGTKADIAKYSIDSITGTAKSPEHMVIVLLGSYELLGEQYVFTEIQEVKKNQMVTTVATSKGYQRPNLAWTTSLHDELTKKDRSPASEKNTQGDICVSCLVNSVANNPSELQKSAGDIATKASVPGDKKVCENIKAEHRKNLIVDLDHDALKREDDEELLEGIAKGTASCTRRIGEQLIQGGWDLISFVGLLAKLGFNGVVAAHGKAVEGVVAVAEVVFNKGERTQMLSSVQKSLEEGVKKTQAGLVYLQQNSIASILNAGGQAIVGKSKGVSEKSSAIGGMMKNMFKNYIGKEKALFACLKGREKVDYYCEWAGYVAGLLLPPSGVYTAVTKGLLGPKMSAAGAKIMEKFLKKPGATEKVVSDASNGVIDSVRTTEALHTGAISADAVQAADKLAKQEKVLGAAAFKELGAKSSPQEIEAVLKTSELASSQGGVAKAVENIGQKHAAELPEGTGKKLMDDLCGCGFCSAGKPKTTVQFNYFMSQFLNTAVAAADAKCAAAAAQMQELLKSVKGLSTDAEKGKTAMYWGRLRNVFEATDNKALEGVFKKLNPEDLENIFYGIKSGMIKVDKPTEEFFDQLWHFTDDVGRAEIWASKDPVFTIKTKMRERDGMAGFSDDPAVAAQLTEAALRRTEVETIARVLGETMRGQKYPNSKWHQGIANFFSPHHDRLSNVLRANNDLREGLQIMYKADEPVLDGIARYGNEVAADGLASMRGLITDTSTKLADSRKQIEKVYGKELAANAPIKEADIRIRELGKKAENFLKSGGSSRGNTIAAGKDMDELGEVLENLWQKKFATDEKWIKEKGLEVHPEYGYVRPAQDLHPVDLQIQNPKMRGETGELRSIYYHTTENNVPKRADYDTTVGWNDDVTFSWTETRYRQVQVTDAQGKTSLQQEAYQHPMSKSDSVYREKGYVLDASFEESLLGKVSPDLNRTRLPEASAEGANRSGVPFGAMVSLDQSGKHFAKIDQDAISKILKSAEQARTTERPYRETINSVTERINSMGNKKYQEALGKADNSTLNGLRDVLQKDRETLVGLKGKLDQYAKTEQSAISRQWIDDKPEIFKDRNRQMQSRVDHMIKRMSYLDEQIARRQASLELELKTPDFSEQLAPLKKIRDRNHTIVVTTGAVTGTVGTAAGVYAAVPEVREKVDSIAAEIGIYKKASKKVEEDHRKNWMK